MRILGFLTQAFIIMASFYAVCFLGGAAGLLIYYQSGIGFFLGDSETFYTEYKLDFCPF